MVACQVSFANLYTRSDALRRGGWGKSGHFYCFCLGNFLNETSEAIDIHVNVAFTNGFKADTVNFKVDSIGDHI